MNFDCGPTWLEQLKASKEWHAWFAWYPVRVGDRTCAWLETIERRNKSLGFSEEWEYRGAKT